MPWQNDDGGPRQKNPWGQGQGGGSGGGPKPPNIDDIIRQSQEKLQKILPGGAGGFVLLGLVAILLWLATGIYTVKPNEQAVILTFGQLEGSRGPGTSWRFPYPIQTVEKREVTTQNTITIGLPSSGRISRENSSLMLAGDENIVDVRFNVVWRINNLANFLFSLENPSKTVASVSESVMRELVGKDTITNIITAGRAAIAGEAVEKIQKILDDYDSGVLVERVQIQEAEAPEEVKDAFLDVQRAQADRERQINEAQAIANRIVPEARGKAEQILEGSKAFAAQAVARAEGDASRFTSVYNEYLQSKSITRKRIYLETMEDVLQGMNKIILDQKGAGPGVVPYLSLSELQKRPTSSSATSNGPGENK